jgi:hypothetical protein
VLTRPRQRSGNKQRTLHRSLQWTLDAITAMPAFVNNGRLDLLAENRLARAFYSDLYAGGSRPPNLARYQFLDAAARQFYADWDRVADVTVDLLRTEAGRNPHDKGLHDLVGELSTRSDEFRSRWGAHNVRRHGTGQKRFHHPIVGDVTLTWQAMAMAAEPGLTLVVYTAEPGSPSADALELLASWVAAPRAAEG